MSGKSDTSRRLGRLPQVGASFRELRLRLGWTQTAVAARAHLSRDTLHRLERGEAVDLSSLVALVTALGYQVSFEPLPQLRAADMRRKFAHLHEEDD